MLGNNKLVLVRLIGLIQNVSLITVTPSEAEKTVIFIYIYSLAISTVVYSNSCI